MRRLLFPLLLTGAVAACAPLHQAPTEAEQSARDAAAQALRTAAPADDTALAPWLVQQRESMAQARAAAQARFAAAETECWQRFAVNACLREARFKRRAELDQLRQQELSLNEIERQRRTQQRLRQLDEKQRAAAQR